MTHAAKNSLALLFFLAAALAPLAPPLARQVEQTPVPRLVATIETGEHMPLAAACAPAAPTTKRLSSVASRSRERSMMQHTCTTS